MCTTGGDNSPLNDDIPILLVLNEKDRSASSSDESWDYHPAVLKDTPRTNLPPVLAIKEGPKRGVPLDPGKLIIAQQRDTFCKQLMRTVDRLDLPFHFNIKGVLIRRSPLDGPTQRVIP